MSNDNQQGWIAVSPEDKAKDLVNKFGSELAVICCKEILSAHFMKKHSGYKTFWLNVLKLLPTPPDKK